MRIFSEVESCRDPVERVTVDLPRTSSTAAAVHDVATARQHVGRAWCQGVLPCSFCAKLRPGPGSWAKEASPPSPALESGPRPRRDTPQGQSTAGSRGVGMLPTPPPAGGRNEKRRPPLRCARLIRSELRTAATPSRRKWTCSPVRRGRERDATGSSVRSGRLVSSSDSQARRRRRAGSASPG
jgi:hypothetical protein